MQNVRKGKEGRELNGNLTNFTSVIGKKRRINRKAIAIFDILRIINVQI